MAATNVTINAMKQRSLAETGFLPKAGKQIRKAVFLAEMGTVVPWSRLELLIEPFSPRRATSDRRFAGLYALDVMPDEGTILRFRHLLEQHDLAVAICAEVNALLPEKCLARKQGKVVDSTLIAAPSSTKNQDKQRDPEMTPTRKGNQWHFGRTSRRRRAPALRSPVAGCDHERSEAAQVAQLGVDAESDLIGRKPLVLHRSYDRLPENDGSLRISLNMALRMICLGDKGKEADRGGFKSIRLKDVADLSGRYLSFEGGVVEVDCLCAPGAKGMIGEGEVRDALVAMP